MSASISLCIEYLQRTREDKDRESDFLNEAINVKKQIDDMSTKELMFKNDLQEAIKKYVEWLEGYIKQNIRTIN